MKVLAFAATNSRQSINKKLVQFSSKLLKNADTEIIDLNDYEIPLFSVDREKELGQSPVLAKQFFEKIGAADALLISYAEHNGSYGAAYKNLFDWTSRIDTKVFQNKPMVILATSPGPGGARNVLNTAKTSAPHFGGNVKADLSIPRFFDVFDSEKNLFKDEKIKKQLEEAVASLQL